TGRETVPVPLFLDLVTPTTYVAPDWEQGLRLQEATLRGVVQRLVQMLSTLAGFLDARGCLVRWRAKVVQYELTLDLEAGGPWEPGERQLVFSGPHPSPHDGGLGMGLLISREIARAHGGSVDDTGEPGSGNAGFAVVLPLGRAD